MHLLLVSYVIHRFHHLTKIRLYASFDNLHVKIEYNVSHIVQLFFSLKQY